MAERWLDRLDRSLGPDVKYAIARRYMRQGRLADAANAFAEAESQLVEVRGADHPHVIATIVYQAACYARIGDEAAACRHYNRALEALKRTESGEHLLVDQISEYLANHCS